MIVLSLFRRMKTPLHNISRYEGRNDGIQSCGGYGCSGRNEKRRLKNHSMWKYRYGSAGKCGSPCQFHGHRRDTVSLGKTVGRYWPDTRPLKRTHQDRRQWCCFSISVNPECPEWLSRTGNPYAEAEWKPSPCIQDTFLSFRHECHGQPSDALWGNER